MANVPHLCTRIVTNHRAVAHFVVTVAVLVLFVQQCFTRFALEELIFIAFVGVTELIKGVSLLYGILKENKTVVITYLVLASLTLLTVSGLIFVVGMMGAAYAGAALPFLICFAAYVTYEWFMFYHVYRFCRILGNRENDEGVSSEQVQVQLNAYR